ncbi:MAG: PF20097 family protein [Gemmatimonadales bacterium]
MSTRPTSCPKCNGPMEEGFVLDKAHYGMPTPPEWLEGKPEVSFWSGLKTKGHDRHKVMTYRCERCGYLESYADLEPI